MSSNGIQEPTTTEQVSADTAMETPEKGKGKMPTTEQEPMDEDEDESEEDEEVRQVSSPTCRLTADNFLTG